MDCKKTKIMNKLNKNEWYFWKSISNNFFVKIIKKITILRALLRFIKSFIKNTLPGPRDQAIGLIGKRDIIAEIGVYNGEFSERILKKKKFVKLYGVDPWLYYPDLYKVENSDKYKQDEQDFRYRNTLTRLKKYIDQGRAVIIRNTADNAAKEDLKDINFDFVYIDGNHGYDYVMSDLQNYSAKLNKKGKICLDDYHFPEVHDAAKDFLEKNEKYEGKVLKNNQFLIYEKF